jgi:hypothetical protein
MDNKNVQRIPVFGVCRGDEAPIVGVRQSGQQRLCQCECPTSDRIPVCNGFREGSPPPRERASCRPRSATSRGWTSNPFAVVQAQTTNE